MDALVGCSCFFQNNDRCSHNASYGKGHRHQDSPSCLNCHNDNLREAGVLEDRRNRDVLHDDRDDHDDHNGEIGCSHEEDIHKAVVPYFVHHARTVASKEMYGFSKYVHDVYAVAIARHHNHGEEF